MLRLDGKVALISGAARGLGAAEASLFAREGAKVVLGDLIDDEGHALASEIVAAGGEAEFVHLDVTDAGQWQLAVAAAEQRFERLDILVNNAGVAQHPAAAEQLPRHEWDRVLEVNLTGQFLGIQAAMPALRRAGGGAIVNTSSVAGLVASRAVAYGASKGGVRLMTKFGRSAGCRVRHSVQLRASGPDRYRVRWALSQRVNAASDAGPDSARTSGPPPRSCLRRPVSGIGRVLLRHRYRIDHRRRHYRDLSGWATLTSKREALG